MSLVQAVKLFSLNDCVQTVVGALRFFFSVYTQNDSVSESPAFLQNLITQHSCFQMLHCLGLTEITHESTKRSYVVITRLLKVSEQILNQGGAEEAPTVTSCLGISTSPVVRI